ncbi:hypothetical protein M6B38_412840 [Iris pallida]|uniref:Uncharacterized protein n=1 Tax=Iris pallida TaxID=29817 RepID=A0AAX6FNL9_IRIPA|nr:hypothetical protein M6B38_412840 [Iris pallida]
MWRRRPDPGSMKPRRGGVGGDVEEDDSSVSERSARTSKGQPGSQGGAAVMVVTLSVSDDMNGSDLSIRVRSVAGTSINGSSGDASPVSDGDLVPHGGSAHQGRSISTPTD